jgi:RNA polymerase sigma-70 factor (ECF subfamily)
MTPSDAAARQIGADGASAPGATSETAAVTVPPFATIYEQYFDFVWRSARRLGVSPAAMDDVVQETFIVIHAKLATVRQPESLRSWIYGVVRRTVSDHRRSQRVRDASGPVLAVQQELEHPVPPTPLDVTQQNDQVKLLFSLLDSLDPPKREVFMLAELEEMTAPEIAAILEIPLNTAYSRLRAARQAFEQALARHVARLRGGA